MGWIILGVIVLIIGLLLWFPIRVGVSSGEGVLPFGSSCCSIPSASSPKRKRRKRPGRRSGESAGRLEKTGKS